LRAAVAYPHATDVYDDAVVAQALAEVGLERLLPMLDTIERWEHRLTDAEKQCLAFAHVILQSPTWVVLNDALDVLDPESRRRIEAIFSGDLANVGIINIGHAAREQGLYARTLHIVSDPHGRLSS
jgi:putative ATP-binding cassette transporter